MFEGIEQEKEIEALESVQWLNTIDPTTTEPAAFHVLGRKSENGKVHQVQMRSFVAIIVKVPSYAERRDQEDLSEEEEGDDEFDVNSSKKIRLT